MKNKIIIISSIGLIALGGFWYFTKYKKKKVLEAEIKAKELEQKFQEEVQKKAEDINSDIINEKKANQLVLIYDSLRKQKLALGSVVASNKKLVELNNEIQKIKTQITELGYKLQTGSSVSKSSIYKR
jgi:uncharacterized Rmd1/YagE family protein